MHDNGEGSFKFAKTLTTPFFGCGMVEIPPEGFKRLKNSRKMHMMFFVHSGKVVVQVCETIFTITKGGFWQVPRGTYLCFISFLAFRSLLLVRRRGHPSRPTRDEHRLARASCSTSMDGPMPRSGQQGRAHGPLDPRTML